MKIFLSYARKDLGIVIEIYSYIRQQTDFEIWFDLESIPHASDWATEIKLGLDNAEVLIFVASRYSLSSLYVKREWIYFKSLGKPIYVWWIDNTPLDVELMHSTIIDMRGDPLAKDKWQDTLLRLSADALPFDWGYQENVIPEYVSSLLRRTVVASLSIYCLIGLFMLVTGNFSILVLFITGFLFNIILNSYISKWVKTRSITSGQLNGLIGLSWSIAIFIVAMPSLLSLFPLSIQIYPEFTIGITFYIVIFLTILLGISPFYTHVFTSKRYTFEPSNKDVNWRFTDFALDTFPTKFDRITLSSLKFNKLLSKSANKWSITPRMMDTKIAWYLPVYSSSLRTPALYPTDDEFFKHLLKMTPQLQQRRKNILILHSSYDYHFSKFLAERIVFTSNSTLQSVDAELPDLSPYDVFVLVVSPYSIRILEALLQKFDDIFVISCLLQDTHVTASTLTRSQWIDARTNYNNAIIALNRLLTDNYPLTIAREGLAPRNAFNAFPAGVLTQAFPISWLSLLAVVIISVLLLALGVLSAVGLALSPVASFSYSIGALKAVSLLVYAILISYTTFRSYLRRSRTLGFLVVLQYIALITFTAVTSFARTPLLIIGHIALAPVCFAIISLINGPNSSNDIGHRSKVNVAIVRIWRPNKRFEFKLIAIYLLLSYLLTTTWGLVDSSFPNNPIGQYEPSWAANLMIDYHGSIDVIGLEVGTGIVEDAVQGFILLNPSREFPIVSELHTVFTFRNIPLGTTVWFEWYYHGFLANRTPVVWDYPLDWEADDQNGLLTAWIYSSSDYLQPGYYELYVKAGDHYIARTTFLVNSK